MLWRYYLHNFVKSDDLNLIVLVSILVSLQHYWWGFNYCWPIRGHLGSSQGGKSSQIDWLCEWKHGPSSSWGSTKPQDIRKMLQLFYDTLARGPTAWLQISFYLPITTFKYFSTKSIECKSPFLRKDSCCRKRKKKKNKDSHFIFLCTVYQLLCSVIHK